MRDINERLIDIQEAISDIAKYTSQGRERFDEDELVRGWMRLQLITIGESLRAFPQDFKDQHPEIAWTQINRMRNILIQVYFGVDNDIVWSVVEDDIPVLKAAIEAILNKEELHE